MGESATHAGELQQKAPGVPINIVSGGGTQVWSAALPREWGRLMQEGCEPTFTCGEGSPGKEGAGGHAGTGTNVLTRERKDGPRGSPCRCSCGQWGSGGRLGRGKQGAAGDHTFGWPVGAPRSRTQPQQAQCQHHLGEPSVLQTLQDINR